MSSTNAILVAEDDDSERDALARVLRLEGYYVLTAKSVDQALERVKQSVSVVVSDLRMGAHSGTDLLRDWRKQGLDTPFIIMTAYGDVDSAVTAMKLGATDFLTKPVNPPELLTLVRECVKPIRSKAVETAEASPDFISRIIRQSPIMDAVCEKTRRAAKTASTVLVLGESGTGKELIAEAIHHHSPRRGGPFVLVNMAAIPDTLVESELFGHVKGAFTGATADRIGRFEAAHAGTLFVDEIGDFPLSLQAKLLRVLENQVVTPVGGNDSRRIDVRVVAATSRDLPRMTAAGKFREDLYYRLNVVVIELPPLRERRQGIPLLTQHFIERLCKVAGKPVCGISPELVAALCRLDWPGNVRQLQNCIESMLVMARGPELTLADLPPNIFERARSFPSDSSAAVTNGQLLEEMKRAAMMRALVQFGGNRTRAAEHLGISVRTIQRKLKEWGMAEVEDSHPSSAL